MVHKKVQKEILSAARFGPLVATHVSAMQGQHEASEGQ
jgi:hypothetical protein